MNILDLPDCVLDIIVSYLPYDDIAKYRIVSLEIFLLFFWKKENLKKPKQWTYQFAL